MNNNFFAAFLLFLLQAYPFSVLAQQEAVLRLNSKLVTLDVMVTDKRTATRVEGLKNEDFEVEDEGRRVEITHFNNASDLTRPLALVFIIDVRNTNKIVIPKLHQALESAIKKLRSDDQIAVMDFWYGYEMVQELTTNRQTVLSAFGIVTKHQETPRPLPKWYHDPVYVEGISRDIADVASAAIKHIGEKMPRSRKALVFISDDLNASSSRLFESTKEQLLLHGVTVGNLMQVTSKYAATLKPIAKTMGTINFRKSESIARYSAETGGEVITIKGDNYSEALEQMLGNLVGRYNVGFVPDEARLDGKLHKLTVKIKASAHIPKDAKLVIRARRGYIATKGAE
jgi:VWFA-related protein